MPIQPDHVLGLPFRDRHTDTQSLLSATAISPLPFSPLTLSPSKMHHSTVLLLFLTLTLVSNSLSYQYKVGDLNAWGPPPPSNPHLYTYWSTHHNFSVGDSLLFLYPPSQDSVVQVTERAFNTCSITTDTISKMDDGNTVFNITTPGYFYFTSGVQGRCQKDQKLAVAVPSANGTFYPPPADAPVATADGPAAYPVVFGPSAAQSSGVGGRVAAVGGVVAAVGAVLIWLL